jgi:enoyl-CoA hydratase/carnithine racemase
MSKQSHQVNIRPIDTGTDQLLCRIEDGVGVVTLNRPEARNALSDILTPALRRVIPELAAMSEVDCIVLTGAGNAFCAGGDVKSMNTAPTGQIAEQTTEQKISTLRHQQATLTAMIYELEKPVIAALPGPAAGAGMSIALSCDIRIAAESAFISSAFRNIGLSGDYGGSWFLTQLVGTAKARELYYTAERVSAQECERLGIVNRVVPDDKLQEEAMTLAKRIASGPPIAIRYMKENMNRAVTQDLRTCLDMEADRVVRVMQTEDFREAVKAFVEKRPPTFRGR